MSSISIGNRRIGDQYPCLIIAEVAQTHDGSLGQAHAFIDAVANANADAIKFQTHIAKAESTPDEPWRVQFSTQDKTRYDYWTRMEFTESQWQELQQHANDRGLIFLSSPFSLEAVALLERLDIPAWKVASGEVSNDLLLNAMVKTGKPVLLSSGMSSWSELDHAVSTVETVPFAIFQCTSAYPCSPEKVGLNIIPALRERYHCPVGLSDHSGTIYPGLAATAHGLSLLEVHVTLSREMFGPDVPASVTTMELRQLVEGVRFVEAMLANPVQKDEMAAEMAPLRALFTKSVVARHELAANTILTAQDLTVKKPGDGIPARELPTLIGRQLCRDVAANERLRLEDLMPYA